ncbi:response regulator [Terrabacter sp. NPDC080008]|uniref:response regulator n=1 Tax=Terrabacter sp. NPDC080008 TaxID=3155176 RepID=UPI00344FBBF3
MSDVRGVRGSQPGEDDLFRWMVAASPDGLWVFDEHGRTTFANGRMARMLGRDPDDMVGFSVFEAVDDVGKLQFRQHLDDLATEGTPGDNLECSLLDSRGNRFWALVSHTPLVDEAGVRRGWMHRVSEHSAQRRLLDQLAEAQAIAHVGSWEWDVVNDEVSWSAELSRIYGLAPTEAMPTVEAFIGRIHPDDRPEVTRTIRAALDSEDSFEFEARLVRADGETRWIRGRGRVTRDPDGRPVRMGGTTQDITQRKDAEVALAMVTAMATAANEAATLDEALPVVLEQIARHTTWRPVLACLGVDSGLGEPMLPPEGVETSLLPVETGMALATRAARDRAVVVEPSSDGTLILAVPVVAHDRVACVVVLDMRTASPPGESDVAAIDQITTLFARVADRERTAEHLAQARDAAEEASRAKSQFLATMSHEIRTPLNGVIGLAELLGRTELSAHQRRLSDGIDQAGRVLLALVNDILDLSKIEAGRLELESVDFDPTAVLEGSVGLLAERSRAKSLDLSVTHGPDVPALVSGDPVRFGQVVANLTANAVKFTDSGSVVVHLEIERGATEEDSSSGPVLRVEVRDTGTGITPEVRSRLFRSFTQGDSSTTRQYGGTGLGLAISRQIVTALGGRIGVESEPGQGATFWFTAAFEPATTVVPGRGAAYAASVSGLRALVVGAGSTHRERLEEQLAAWSVQVTTAATGVEGLVQLDRAHGSGRPLDVVLLDDPDTGDAALQVARMIRSDERFEGVRVVLVCAKLPPPDASLLTGAGVDAVLTAPVMPSGLFDAMSDVAGRHLASRGPAGAGDGRADGPGPAGGERVVVGVAPLAATRTDGALGTVLVVEDNEVNQLVAQGVLESLGYTVRLAANGLEGVAAYRGHGADVVAVLMDCQMPRMDGYAATRAIRAHEPPGRRVPVIAMTASAIAGERERCLQAGMDDFLTKPIDVALLASTLQRWVPSGAVASPAATDGGRSVEGGSDGKAGPDGGAEVDKAVDTAVDTEVVSEAGPEVDPEVLDAARLAELRDLEPGDPSMLLRFIDRFGSGARQRLDDLRAAHRAGDAESQGRVAHGLKGSASNLGAVTLAAVCKQVEDLGSDGRLADDALMDRVAAEVDRATQALEAYGAALR